MGTPIQSRLRFDYPVSESAGEEYAMDVQKVVAHAFFPFISYDKVLPRYNKARKKVKLKIRPIMQGKRNFISYTQRAHEIISLNHNNAIRNQIERHWAMVNRLLDDADTRLATSEGKEHISGSEHQEESSW